MTEYSYCLSMLNIPVSCSEIFLCLNKFIMYMPHFREKKSAVDRKRRRKPKENLEEQEEDMEVTEEGLENLEMGADPQDIADPDVTSGANADPRFTLEGDRNNSAGEVTTYDDGVFKVTIGPQTSNMDCELDEAMDSNDAAVPLFTPAPRMNAQMAIMNNVLYLYGGIFEEGDKQVTLTDFYSLDLHKLEGWTTIISDDRVQVRWQVQKEFLSINISLLNLLFPGFSCICYLYFQIFIFTY